MQLGVPAQLRLVLLAQTLSIILIANVIPLDTILHGIQLLRHGHLAQRYNVLLVHLVHQTANVIFVDIAVQQHILLIMVHGVHVQLSLVLLVLLHFLIVFVHKLVISLHGMIQLESGLCVQLYHVELVDLNNQIVYVIKPVILAQQLIIILRVSGLIVQLLPVVPGQVMDLLVNVIFKDLMVLLPGTVLHGVIATR